MTTRGDGTDWSRRDVLAGAGAAALAALAAACAPQGGGPAPTAAATTAPSRGGGVAGSGVAPTTKAGRAPRAAPTSADPAFVATELLARPTATSITLNVVPARAMQVAYEYGTSPGAYDRRTALQAASPGEPLETVLEGLRPDTRYYTRLRHDDGVGQERTFTTQRSPGSTFRFAVQGDSHPERVGRQFDEARYVRTLSSAAADRPDFYVAIGDDFSVDALKTIDAGVVRSLYVNQRQWLGRVGAPVFLVNGNHEQAARVNLDGTPDNVAVWAQTSRNRYFSPPAPDGFYTGDSEEVEHIGLLRDYYAFTWGDAVFVVIDPYWHSPVAVDNRYGADRDERNGRDLWAVTLGETQYRWFRSTLESSPARHKFVFAHHVNGTGRGGIELARTFEWGDTAGFATRRPGWGKPIHQVMAYTDVSVFFQGHDHLFARQQLDGVVYQTLPQPASPNPAVENAAAYRSGDRLPNSGHLRVTVAPDEVGVDYVRSHLDRDDEVAFSYTVPARR